MRRQPGSRKSRSTQVATALPRPDSYSEGARIGKRGTVVIPAVLRRRLGLEEGATVLIEQREDGVLIRPAVIAAVELYTPERRAEFRLSNAVDAEDYEQAVAEVRRLGLDPAKIPHVRPAGA